MGQEFVVAAAAERDTGYSHGCVGDESFGALKQSNRRQRRQRRP